MLREGIPGEKQRAFDTYFEKFFQQFEKPVRGNGLDDLPRLRKDLKGYFREARNREANTQLADLTMKNAKRFLREKYQAEHDAAIKINAMLIIAELNDLDGNKPSPKALPILLNAFSKAPKDYFKVAALVGLDRYAAANAIPPASAAELSKQLLDLVNQKQPPAGRTSAAHDYMRRSATRVLTSMGSPGPNNAVVQAFEAIVADPSARLMLRCEIAQFIGQLKYTSAAKVDFQALANTLGHQAADICLSELDAAKTEKRPPSRRRIVYALSSSKDALSGLQAPAADTPAKKFVSDLYAKLKIIHGDIDSPDLTDESVDAEVTVKIKDLQSILGPKAAVAKQEVAKAEPKEKPTEPAKQ
jgi:hypothetical protein